MKDIVVVHKADRAAEELAAALERDTGRLSVAIVDLDSATGNVMIPPALLKSLQRYGERCLPALIADGVLVKQGHLPEYQAARALIERGEADPGTDLELDRLLTVVKGGDGGAKCCAGPHCCS